MSRIDGTDPKEIDQPDVLGKFNTNEDVPTNLKDKVRNVVVGTLALASVAVDNVAVMDQFNDQIDQRLKGADQTEVSLPDKPEPGDLSGVVADLFDSINEAEARKEEILREKYIEATSSSSPLPPEPPEQPDMSLESIKGEGDLLDAWFADVNSITEESETKEV